MKYANKEDKETKKPENMKRKKEPDRERGTNKFIEKEIHIKRETEMGKQGEKIERKKQTRGDKNRHKETDMKRETETEIRLSF